MEIATQDFLSAQYKIDVNTINTREVELPTQDFLRDHCETDVLVTKKVSGFYGVDVYVPYFDKEGNRDNGKPHERLFLSSPSFETYDEALLYGIGEAVGFISLKCRQELEQKEVEDVIKN